MKKLKKTLALLLCAAMIFMFPAMTYAADGDTYVDGFMNQDGQYCMRVGNFGMVNLVNYIAAQAPGDDTWHIRVRILVDNSTVFHCSLDSNLNATVVPSKVGSSEVSETAFYDWDFSDNAPIGARVYINDDQFSDTGIVIFFNDDSIYLKELANVDTILIQTELENEDSSVFVTIGDPGVWYTINAEFKGLEAYKTTSDTNEPTIETEEVLVETEEIIVETEEISADTEETAIETEEVITADEETEEIIAETEEPATVPETKEPVTTPETEDNSDTVTETPEESKPMDTYTNEKTSPDTGITSVAAGSAVALLALGTFVLSRKKK